MPEIEEGLTALKVFIRDVLKNEQLLKIMDPLILRFHTLDMNVGDIRELITALRGYSSQMNSEVEYHFEEVAAYSAEIGQSIFFEDPNTVRTGFRGQSKQSRFTSIV